MMSNQPILKRIVNLLGGMVLLFLITSFILQDVIIEISKGPDLNAWVLGLILFFGFLISLVTASMRVPGIVRQYFQELHDLGEEQAADMIYGIMYGIPRSRKSKMTLKVADGRLNAESASAVRRVGGPGYLSIAAEHVVVTCRFGMLYRTLEAGSHPLKPFEKVWDIIDLRPQYREITVPFTTASGIPAQCKVNVLFRIQSPGVENAFRLATQEKYVKNSSGRNRFLDWSARIVDGVLASAVRDLLEYYELDQFINPSRHLFQPHHTGNPNPPPLMTMSRLEAYVMSTVKNEGQSRGILIEQIEMSEIKPDDEAVMRQWLELWNAYQRIGPDKTLADVNAQSATELAKDFAEKRARLVTSFAQEVANLASMTPGVPAGSQNIRDALESMLTSTLLDAVLDADEDSPAVKSKLL